MNVISPEELLRGPLYTHEQSRVSGLILVYKKWGDTPLQTLSKLKGRFPVLEGVPLSYAGRLDPLAEGLMLVLVGEENKNRDVYLGLNKTYEFEVLLGMKTDTGDLFGVFDTRNTNHAQNRVDLNTLMPIVHALEGDIEFKYPIYSSKTVEGIPLFQYANENKIKDGYIEYVSLDGLKKKIPIPSKKVHIEKIELKDMHTVECKEVLTKALNAIEVVTGDFRYDEIRNSLEEFKSNICNENKDVAFTIVKLSCACSSGTYMRVLSEKIGFELGVPSLAYSIKRTNVGEFSIQDTRLIILD